MALTKKNFYIHPYPQKMVTPQPVHDRKYFQIDRIAFFSDAIIAIASTLLILEFKIPSLGKDKSWPELQVQYSGKLLIPISGLLISFFSISRLWMKHHELFEHVNQSGKQLLRLNLVFLFLIMMIPVSTSFVLDYNNPSFLRLAVYFGNLGLCNLALHFLLQAITSSKNVFSILSRDQYLSLRKKDISILIAGSFLGAAVLSFFSVTYFYLPFIPLGLYRIYRDLMFLKDWYKRRKHGALRPGPRHI